MKITIVHESMFGNTHEVAAAIGDGVREARPDADVECVPVVEAAPELIKSTDLLIVGGPTHIRGMTSGFTRKMGVSAEKKAEQRVSRLMSWRRMVKARESECGSTICQGRREWARRSLRHPPWLPNGGRCGPWDCPPVA